MYLCLFEDDQIDHLRPLVDTRPVYDLRIGGRRIGEQTARAFDSGNVLLHCRAELADTLVQSDRGPVNHVPGALGVLFVNGRAVFTPGDGTVLAEIQAASKTSTAQIFKQGGDVVAAWLPNGSTINLAAGPLTAEAFSSAAPGAATTTVSGVPMVSRMWHLLEHIDASIKLLFRDRSHGYNILERTGAIVHPSAVLENGERILIADGAIVKPGAILDAAHGPIIIDEGAVVSERALIVGPAYVGRGSQVKVGANLRMVAMGPRCKVGGEVHDAIFQAFSNKAHDGFLGNAFIGSWCNLGAATNNSNLKNDYGSVNLMNLPSGRYEDTGQQFVGLFMADHSKCSIGTTFNTGTVVGVGCNLFGSGFHPRYVPAFCWGSPERYATYRFEKAMSVAERVYQRRDRNLSDADRALLQEVFDRYEPARADFLGKRKTAT